LYNYLTEFGFGKKTGVDFPSETSGILSNYSNWTNIDTGTIAFGQGISVSAVQLVTAVSAIANGGFMVKPYIVQSVSNPDGTLNRESGKTEPRRILSQETADKIKEIMATVVTDGGTGVKAALNGYTVCGKTGTAQKIEKNVGYSKQHFTSSFIGFAPKSHPEVTVLVLLDEPKAGHYGGTVAAPAFKKIMHGTLNYLNIAPEKDTNDATMMLAQRNEVKP
jgi:cell division protein FtsI (penicillin-binding protein 3)